MPENTLSEPLQLRSFVPSAKVAVIGASGGIGAAFANDLATCASVAQVYRLSRAATKSPAPDFLPLDLEDERSIENAATALKAAVGSLDMVIVATGLLHEPGGLQPEKSWRMLDSAALEKMFRINTIGPALVAKHFLPLLARDRKTVFAALSARVGSIEDNHLGGWYGYRASKAALNMMLKTLSIELARRNPNALCVGLHPGTVDTGLSDPFQRGVPAARLFTPAASARYLLNTLDRLTVADTGMVYAWDGSPVPA